MARRTSMPRPKTKAAIPNRVPLPKARSLVKPTPEQLVAQKEAIMAAGKAGTIADATAQAARAGSRVHALGSL